MFADYGYYVPHFFPVFGFCREKREPHQNALRVSLWKTRGSGLTLIFPEYGGTLGESSYAPWTWDISSESAGLQQETPTGHAHP